MIVLLRSVSNRFQPLLQACYMRMTSICDPAAVTPDTMPADPADLVLWSLQGTTLMYTLTGATKDLNFRTPSGEVVQWDISDDNDPAATMTAQHDPHFKLTPSSFFPPARKLQRGAAWVFSYDAVKDCALFKPFSSASTITIAQHAIVAASPSSPRSLPSSQPRSEAPTTPCVKTTKKSGGSAEKMVLNAFGLKAFRKRSKVAADPLA